MGDTQDRCDNFERLKIEYNLYVLGSSESPNLHITGEPAFRKDVCYNILIRYSNPIIKGFMVNHISKFVIILLQN